MDFSDALVVLRLAPRGPGREHLVRVVGAAQGRDEAPPLVHPVDVPAQHLAPAAAEGRRAQSDGGGAVEVGGEQHDDALRGQADGERGHARAPRREPVRDHRHGPAVGLLALRGRQAVDSGQPEEAGGRRAQNAHHAGRKRLAEYLAQIRAAYLGRRLRGKEGRPPAAPPRRRGRIEDERRHGRRCGRSGQAKLDAADAVRPGRVRQRAGPLPLEAHGARADKRARAARHHKRISPAHFYL